LAKDRAFYGFEGPILFEENPRPLTMVPEDSNANDYQKFWLFDESSAKYLTIVEGDYDSGVNSLQFSGYGKNESLEAEKVTALTPKGAINIPEGDYKFSMRVWLDQGRIANKIYVNFLNPVFNIEFDNLKELPRRQWVTLEKTIKRPQASTSTDQLQIEIRKGDLPKTKAAKLFIDNIVIEKVK